MGVYAAYGLLVAARRARRAAGGDAARARGAGLASALSVVLGLHVAAGARERRADRRALAPRAATAGSTSAPSSEIPETARARSCLSAASGSRSSATTARSRRSRTSAGTRTGRSARAGHRRLHHLPVARLPVPAGDGRVAAAVHREGARPSTSASRGGVLVASAADSRPARRVEPAILGEPLCEPVTSSTSATCRPCHREPRSSSSERFCRCRSSRHGHSCLPSPRARVAPGWRVRIRSSDVDCRHPRGTSLPGADPRPRQQRQGLDASRGTRQARSRPPRAGTRWPPRHADRHTGSAGPVHDGRSRAGLARNERIAICSNRAASLARVRVRYDGDSHRRDRGLEVLSRRDGLRLRRDAPKSVPPCACAGASHPRSTFGMSSGRSSLLLLTGSSGEQVGARAASLAGEAVTLAGTIVRQAGWLVIRSDPSSWRLVSR